MRLSAECAMFLGEQRSEYFGIAVCDFLHFKLENRFYFTKTKYLYVKVKKTNYIRCITGLKGFQELFI